LLHDLCPRENVEKEDDRKRVENDPPEYRVSKEENIIPEKIDKQADAGHSYDV